MRAQGTRAGASVPSVPWAAPVAHLPVSTQGVAELPRGAGRGNPACGCLRECRRAARGGRAFWVSPISVPEQKGGRDLLESPEDRGTRPCSLSLAVLPLLSESLTRTTMTPREGEQDRQGPSSQPSPVPRPALGCRACGHPTGHRHRGAGWAVSPLLWEGHVSGGSPVQAACFGGPASRLHAPRFAFKTGIAAQNDER